MDKVKVGIIGCGNISDQYFKGCAQFEILELAACADIKPEVAQQKGAQYGVPAVSVDQLLADPDIQIVLNLTIPQVHVEVDLAAIAAGKHPYAEKPFALVRENGQKVLQAAQDKGLHVGSAPDTFLGGGLQTARKVLDDGLIGDPVAATAFMVGHGHEHWHPNPEFYYKAGGGPMLDMGPYYLTALVHLLGPAKRVTGLTKKSFKQRRVTSQPNFGQIIDVDVSTHLTGVIEYASGALATIIMSFDVWSHNLPRIEVYGTEGSMVVPDPNRFDGQVYVRRADEKEWSEVPLTHSATVGRGIGTADMAYAITTGRPQRASGQLAYHVLDTMLAFDEASLSGKHIPLTSTVERPAALPIGFTSRTSGLGNKTMSQERFFVTGALGCLGAWVTRNLIQQGAEVVVYDLGSSDHRLRLIMSDDEIDRVNFVAGDITDLDAVQTAMEGATHVIHLAALQVPFCKANPPLGARVNVVGTVNIFESVKKLGGIPLVYASSVAVFGGPEDYEERLVGSDVKLNPRNLYGVYKRANEGTADIYYQDDSISSIGLRPYTIYGPGRDQGMTSTPTKAMLSAAAGQAYHISYGGYNGFQYVDDVAKIFIQAARAGFDGAAVYNLGGSVAHMKEIVAAIEAAAPDMKGQITFEDQALALPDGTVDTALVEAIGTLPFTPLDEGVASTIAHFKQALAEGKVSLD